MWIKYFRHEKVRGTNTNNFIESYHKKIKYMYLAARFNRRVDFLVNELAIKILRDYRQETIQYELNIGRMSSYNKICRQFEINSADIDNNSIFRLEDSIFVVKSTQSITDYIVERHNNDFVCNCEFYFKNPVSCKHIYAILRKYNIETLEQYTYLLPNNNQEYNDQQEYNDNNQSNISEELNGSIDQWLEHLKMLHKEANLDNIPLDERKKIINKLKDICAIFMYN
jgi:hypothetical protein